MIVCFSAAMIASANGSFPPSISVSGKETKGKLSPASPLSKAPVVASAGPRHLVSPIPSSSSSGAGCSWKHFSIVFRTSIGFHLATSSASYLQFWTTRLYSLSNAV